MALAPATNLIRISYQIKEFAESTDRGNEIPRETAVTALYIISKHPRPEPVITRSNQGSLPYPSTWDTNPAQFKRAISAFRDQTFNLRESPEVQLFFRRYEAPSTGNTPTHERSISPVTRPPSPERRATSDPLSSRATSADGAIYRYPIGLALPPPGYNMDELDQGEISNPGFSPAQRNELRLMFSDFARTMQPQPQPRQPLQPDEPPVDLLGQALAAPGHSTRWIPGEVGFFDPMYDGKSVSSGAPALEHTGKDTYFRNVHLFIERADEHVSLKGEEVVKNNLWTCLRGTALEWWTGELSEVEHRITKLGDGIKEWSTLLRGRFKEDSNVAINNMLREKYTLRDAANRREPREFAQKIIRSAKDAGLLQTSNQLDMIYSARRLRP